MNKVLVTGGSGFIGTNLINYLFGEGNYSLLSIDIVRPKIASHEESWQNVDLRDLERSMVVVVVFISEGTRSLLTGLIR